MSDGVPADEVPWDRSADVVVVGGGAAGFAAAVGAARAGASVLLLECNADVGGTTARSGGYTWVPGNHLMAAAGIHEDRDAILRYMAEVADPAGFDPSAERLGLNAIHHANLVRFLDEGQAVLRELEAAGAIVLELERRFPCYAPVPPRVPSIGRSLVPVGKPAIPEEGMGGEVLIAQLRAGAERLDVTVLVEHRVVDAVLDEQGAVAGLEVRTRGTTVLVRARRGVVFGTGGFLHEPTLVAEHLPGRIAGGCAVPSSRGDFVRIAERLGTAFGNMDEAWWDQVALEPILRNPSSILDVTLPFGDSMIQVDARGQRVLNEKLPYNERAKVHLVRDVDDSYPNRLLFMVYDDAVATDPTVSGFRFPVPMPGTHVDHVISGADLPALAAAIDERLAACGSDMRLSPDFAANLAATIARFDRHAHAGSDPDFHRGATEIEQLWGAAGRNGPNPTMHPFHAEGPYHCVILAAGALDTKGGPVVDADGRVLSTSGRPIPRLFGAGNCVASAAGAGYWGPGATIGLAVVGGYLAGRSAASE